MLMRMAFEPEMAHSTADLAKDLGLSRNHLSKIMQRLARGGIVETRRGSGGGATLARAPQDICLGDVVRLLEEDQPLVECFDANTNTCAFNGRCALKARLRAAEAAFLASLDQGTLADIALPRAQKTIDPALRQATRRLGHSGPCDEFPV
jgi:Rrf2 family nitric oxide-sensitive transcriptional repressor